MVEFWDGDKDKRPTKKRMFALIKRLEIGFTTKLSYSQFVELIKPVQIDVIVKKNTKMTKEEKKL